eukprot:EG_transcript_10617
MERLPLWLNKGKPKLYKLQPKCRSPFPSPSFSNELLKALGEEIVAFSQWVQPTERERAARQDFTSRVEQVVLNLWPTASVKVFGSSQTGLALPISDVDFMVEGHASSTLHMTDLADALQEYGMANVRVIANAKVPLIKFLDPQSHLSGDISFCVRNATESVHVVKKYLAQYAAAKPLILVLKTLLHQNNLNVVHTGGLSSYAITLLVVSYLRVLESTATEKENAALADLDGVALGHAFIGFVKYFASTDFRNYVFAPGRDLPVSIRKCPPYPPHGTTFMLEDPLDATNDITRGTYMFGQVQLLLWYSLQALAQYPSYGHGVIPSILSSVINPRDFHFLSRFNSLPNEERNDDRGE